MREPFFGRNKDGSPTTRYEWALREELENRRTRRATMFVSFGLNVGLIVALLIAVFK